MTTAAEPPGSAGGPTVLRMLLGAQLRRLREAQGVTPRGRRMGDPRLRVEDQPDGAGPGQLQGARRRRPADALRRRATAHEREALLTLARQANTPGLVAPLRRRPARLVPVLPGLEAAASLIRTYEIQFVPGLLQTRGLRPRGHPARPRRRDAGGDRPARRAAPAAPEHARPAGAAAAVGGHRRGGAAPADRRRRAVMQAQIEALIEATKQAERPAADHAVPRRRARRGGRAVRDPAVPGAGAARRRLRRAAHQRDLPGQARRRRASTRWPWSGSASTPSRRTTRRRSSASCSRTSDPASPVPVGCPGPVSGRRRPAWQRTAVRSRPGRRSTRRSRSPPACTTSCSAARTTSRRTAQSPTALASRSRRSGDGARAARLPGAGGPLPRPRGRHPPVPRHRHRDPDRWTTCTRSPSGSCPSAGSSTSTTTRSCWHTPVR